VQLLQVMMNLIMNSIDAMKDVDDTRELVIKSQNSENEHYWSPSAIPRGTAPQQATRSSMPSLLPSQRTAWDFASAAPSSNRMVPLGLPTNPRGASFCFTYHESLGQRMTHEALRGVPIREVAAARAPSRRRAMQR